MVLQLRFWSPEHFETSRSRALCLSGVPPSMHLLLGGALCQRQPVHLLPSSSCGISEPVAMPCLWKRWESHQKRKNERILSWFWAKRSAIWLRCWQFSMMSLVVSIDNGLTVEFCEDRRVPAAETKMLTGSCKKAKQNTILPRVRSILHHALIHSIRMQLLT